MPNPRARVLIIENRDALRVMLFTILRHQTLQVDTAASAAEALEHVQECDYALILIDLGLPDREAHSFLARFREVRPGSTTFVLAARDARDEEPLDSDLIAAVVSKPLELNTLGEAIRECALVVPPPEEPLHCPPAESEVRDHFDRTGESMAN